MSSHYMTKRCADHSAQRFFKVLGAIQALFATATTRFAYPDMSSMSEYMVGKMTSVRIVEIDRPEIITRPIGPQRLALPSTLP